MKRPTPEEARRLTKQGVFDVGISYFPPGIGRVKKHKFWDGWVPPEERGA
jgi:hypothetical protein